MKFTEKIVSFFLIFWIGLGHCGAKVSYLTPTDFTVCNQRCKSRLGDHLNTYIKARWFAHKANLPFYYAPFEYSDLFALSMGKPRDDLFRDQQMTLIRISDVDNIPKISKQSNVLFLIDLFSQFKKTGNPYKQMLDDQKFMEIIRKELSCRVPIDVIAIPSDHFSIAVHVRKGSGVDFPLYSEQIYDSTKAKKIFPKSLPPGFTEKDKSKYDDARCPLRFPPEQYYIDQIQIIAKKHSDRPIYVFLFTDEPDTQALLDRFRQEIPLSNVTFDARKHNSLNAHVLEDFFSMMQFDCLIRPGRSAYSILAHFLGKHDVVIYPIDYAWHGNHLVMKKIQIENRK